MITTLVNMLAVAVVALRRTESYIGRHRPEWVVARPPREYLARHLALVGGQ